MIAHGTRERVPRMSMGKLSAVYTELTVYICSAVIQGVESGTVCLSLHTSSIICIRDGRFVKPYLYSETKHCM
jgi:hypothetical protein